MKRGFHQQRYSSLIAQESEKSGGNGAGLSPLMIKRGESVSNSQVVLDHVAANSHDFLHKTPNNN